MKKSYSYSAEEKTRRIVAGDGSSFIKDGLNKKLIRVEKVDDAFSDKDGACLNFNRKGYCPKGESCLYLHDRSKVAVCRDFLQGSCHNLKCSNTHWSDKGKIPLCYFFSKGKCYDDNCKYLHVGVNKLASVCSSFLEGNCTAGDRCKFKHMLDFTKDENIKKRKRENISNNLLDPFEQPVKQMKLSRQDDVVEAEDKHKEKEKQQIDRNFKLFLPKFCCY